MKIMNYVMKLLPSLGRNELLDNIDTLIRTQREANIPAWETLVSQAKDSFSNPKIKGFEKIFERELKGVAKGGMLKIVLEATKNSIEVLEFIKGLVQEEFAETVERDGVTYRKANIIQFADAMEFVADYQRLFARWLVVAETNFKHPTSDSPADVFEPGALKLLDSDFEAFVVGIKFALLSRKDLETGFFEIPDIVVNQQSNSIAERTHGLSALDPFMMSGFCATKNPIYWLRMQHASRVVDKYNAALADRQALEARLIYMRELQKQDPNPKTEQIIKYNEDRLARLNTRIRDTEEKYGG